MVRAPHQLVQSDPPVGTVLWKQSAYEMEWTFLSEVFLDIKEKLPGE